MATMQSTSLEQAFDKSLQLAFPPVMIQLLQALLDPAPSFSSIAGFLKMDPILAGKILHIVNSASYGFERKITDLQRAAIAIGINDLFRLVVSLSLQKNLQPVVPRNSEQVFADWRVTLWGALSAEAIASHFCPEQKGEAYLTGMLKDLPLLLAFCRPEVPTFLQRERLATLPEPDDAAQELLTWGSAHQEQCHNIFLSWNIPEAMAEAVLAHHDFGGVADHPPMTRSVIYATRWAELLSHGRDAYPGALIAFELDLAAELGLDAAGMERFRRACTDKFNLLLEQLTIAKARPETRLYEQTLANLQSYYFLALEVIGDSGPRSAHMIASRLQRQLRLFWNLAAWNMCLTLPGNERQCVFHCEGDTLLDATSDESEPPAPARDWETLPIASGGIEYGILAVPGASTSPELGNLPLFAHMLGMCLRERALRQGVRRGLPVESSIEALPLVLARLDGEGRVQDASSLFLETFGLPEVPAGRPAFDLLKEHIGLSRSQFDAKAPVDGAGSIISVPEGRFPGTPFYLAHTASDKTTGDSFLLLGDVTRLSPLQALAVTHPGLLESLFSSIPERICVLSGEGLILWADPASQDLPGRNIFSLVCPDTSFSGAWTPPFLTDIREPVSLRGLFSYNGRVLSCSLSISPLGSGPSRQYLTVLSGLDRCASPQNGANTPPDRQRDALTGLYGYSQFHILMQHMAELGQKQHSGLGILFCEISSLREVNLVHGAIKGDMLLRHIADSLVSACRPGKDCPCRYGTDTFAVLVSRAAATLMESLAGNIYTLAEDRTGKLLRIGIGLTLVAPGHSPRPHLDLAKEAARRALGSQTSFLWADCAVPPVQ